MTTTMPKKQRTSDYEGFLAKRLHNQRLAAAYLTASFEEGEEAFLLAIKDVAKARGGINHLAQSTALNRENLYAMLSKRGNPRLSSLAAIMQALGMKLAIRPA